MINLRSCSFPYDRLYFLLKDPHWAFLWWELAPETVEALGTRMGEDTSTFVLRIHDVTDLIFDGRNSHWHWDIDVNFWTDHWYLHIPVVNRNYVTEIGFRARDGRFVRAALSNTLFVPRDCPAEAIAADWSILDV